MSGPDEAIVVSEPRVVVVTRPTTPRVVKVAPGAPGGDGSGTLTGLTSMDGSVDITNPDGPVPDLSVSGAFNSVRLLKFIVNFDDVGLAAGKAIYIPTDGDLILNGIVRVVTAFDGTTPFLDLGTAVDTSTGWFGKISSGGPVSVATADSTTALDDPDIASQDTAAGGAVSDLLGSWNYVLDTNYRVLPGVVVDTQPIKAWVTQNGLAGGAGPGSTQGRAEIYLFVATPGAGEGGGSGSGATVAEFVYTSPAGAPNTWGDWTMTGSDPSPDSFSFVAPASGQVRVTVSLYARLKPVSGPDTQQGLVLSILETTLCGPVQIGPYEMLLCTQDLSTTETTLEGRCTYDSGVIAGLTPGDTYTWGLQGDVYSAPAAAQWYATDGFDLAAPFGPTIVRVLEA